MKRFYSPRENFAGSTVSFDEEETRHIRDVIRLKEEDIIAVFDGEGREVERTAGSVDEKVSQAVIVEEIPPAAPESPVRLELAAAMLKSDKFDITVQKAVELGVDKITPLRTARCDIKSKDSLKRTARWRKIALEASKQCGRAVLMEIADPMSLEEYLNALNAVENEMRLCLSKRMPARCRKADQLTVVRMSSGRKAAGKILR